MWSSEYRASQLIEDRATLPIKIGNLKIYKSNQPGALDRLKTFKVSIDHEPGLWGLALQRFNFELKGQKQPTEEEEDVNVMIVALHEKVVVGFLLFSTANSRLSRRPKIDLNGCITFEVNITSVATTMQGNNIGKRLAGKVLEVVNSYLNEETPLGFVLLKSTPWAQGFWEGIGFKQGFPPALGHIQSALNNAGYEYHVELQYEFPD